MDITHIVKNTALYAFTLQGVSLATRLLCLLCAEEKKHQGSVCDGVSSSTLPNTSSGMTLSDTSAASGSSQQSHSCVSPRPECNFISSSESLSLIPPFFADACTSVYSTPLPLFVPDRLDVESMHHVPFQRFSSVSQCLQEQFTRYKYHIFIGAMGIAVRSIAPFIQNKKVDPGVIVIDQKGQFVISVLSGHIGNANDLTEYVAKKIHATPVITTATDVEGLPAIDALATKKGLRIESMEAAKNISAAILSSKKIKLYDPYNWLQLERSPHSTCFENISHSTSDVQQLHEENSPIVIVTEKRMKKKPFTLVLAPPLLCVGIGCKRGTSADTIITQLTSVFEQKGLSLSSLSSLASVDIKKDEKGLLETAKKLGVPLCFFSPEELNAYPTQNVSEKCLATFGIKGVCESSALAAAGKDAQLEQEKIAGNGVTIAIARRTQIPPRKTE